MMPLFHRRVQMTISTKYSQGLITGTFLGSALAVPMLALGRFEAAMLGVFTIIMLAAFMIAVLYDVRKGHCTNL
jgi:hypothetical protein